MRTLRFGGRRVLASGLACVLVLSVCPAGAAASDEAPDPAGSIAAGESGAPTGPGQAAPTVTLVTGDVVQVDGTGAKATGSVVTDVPPLGDTTVFNNGEELFAIPRPAAPLLSAGELDPRLFNLSLLVRDGYTDQRRSELPVIVRSGQAARQRGALAGAKAQRELPAAGLRAVAMDKKQGSAFWAAVTDPAPAAGGSARPAGELRLAPGVDHVWLDGTVRASDDVSGPAVGADKAWAAGYDGSGQTVAVLDTGIDTGHPDLAGQVLESRSFIEGEDAGDRNGHGTHVASIIAGTGAASGGRYAGVAPKAKLINGKVLSDAGSGLDSQIIAGMEWAASKAEIVNMSLGGCCTDGTDPLATALNEISRRTGALFVVAAGNTGRAIQVGTPAVADEALSVAAATRNGSRLAGYSSRGPRSGDWGIKPEIAAPGSDIVAAHSSQSSRRPLPDNDKYTRLSGTSMATPHTAAMAAIVRQQHPDWSRRQLRDALLSTSTPMNGTTGKPYPIWQQGIGIADVGEAVTTAVHATGTLDLGIDRHPQAPGDTTAGAVTYTNSGDQPVTLDVAAPAWQRPQANPLSLPVDWAPLDWTPPAGTVTVEPARVTVPAGGSASVQVTVRTAELPFTRLYGRMVATGANDVSVTTAVSVGRDTERHHLEVHATDIDGSAPDPRYSAIVAVGVETRATSFGYFGADGRLTWFNMSTPLPLWGGGLVKDTYRLFGFFSDLGKDVYLSGWTVRLDKPAEVTIDGRAAREMQFRTERPTINHLTEVYLRDTHTGSVLIDGASTPYRMYQLLGPDREGAEVRYHAVRVPPHLRLTRGRLAVQPVRTGPWAAQHGGQPPACLNCKQALPADGMITLVDGGDGSPEALAGKDLRGKVALIREAPRPAENELLVDDEVNAAVAAGAIGVVLVVDSAPLWRLAAWDHPIWSTLVSPADGAALAGQLRHGPVRMKADSGLPEPYRYELHSSDDDYRPVPPDAVYPIDHDDLATVTTRMHAPAGTWSFIYEHTLKPGAPVTGTVEPFRARSRMMGYLPQVRTDYVSPGRAGYTWYGVPGANGWIAYTARPALKPGQLLTRDALSGPMVPGRLLDQPLARSQNGAIDLLGSPIGAAGPFLGSGDGFGGWDSRDGTRRTQVLRGDEVVCDREDVLTGCRISQSGPHRILVDTSQDKLPTSPHTTTEWSLNADPAAATVPLILAEYDLPVDLNNAVPDRDHRLSLKVGYQPGGPAAPSAWRVKAWATFDDGATWEPVYDRWIGRDGRFAPEVDPPRRHNGFVGLRVRAEDGRGNAIDQTALRAYALRGH